MKYPIKLKWVNANYDIFDILIDPAKQTLLEGLWVYENRQSDNYSYDEEFISLFKRRNKTLGGLLITSMGSLSLGIYKKYLENNNRDVDFTVVFNWNEPETYIKPEFLEYLNLSFEQFLSDFLGNLELNLKKEEIRKRIPN